MNFVAKQEQMIGRSRVATRMEVIFEEVWKTSIVPKPIRTLLLYKSKKSD